jgi:hypothetical protein
MPDLGVLERTTRRNCANHDGTDTSIVGIARVANGQRSVNASAITHR